VARRAPGHGEYALEPGRDPNSLASAGWGLIFPAAADKALVDAVSKP